VRRVFAAQGIRDRFLDRHGTSLVPRPVERFVAQRSPCRRDGILVVCLLVEWNRNTGFLSQLFGRSPDSRGSLRSVFRYSELGEAFQSLCSVRRGS